MTQPVSTPARRTRALATGLAVGVLGTTLVGGLGFAAASSSTQTKPSPSASGPAATGDTGHAGKGAHQRFGAQALGRVLHGEGVVKTKKGYQTVDARGTFTVTGTSVTVKSADGAVSPAFTLGPDTKVRAAKQKATTSAVTSGKQGEIVGVKGATGLVARLVVVK